MVDGGTGCRVESKMRASTFLAASVIIGGAFGVASSAQAGALSSQAGGGAPGSAIMMFDSAPSCSGADRSSCLMKVSARSGPAATKSKSAAKSKSEKTSKSKTRFIYKYRKSREARRDEYRHRRAARRSNNYYYIIDRFGRHNDGFIYLARPRPQTLSCSKVRHMLRNAGWRISASLDCKGETYSFRGFHGSSRYVVVVDAIDGTVIERQRG
jgi:hypothetical protein